MYKGQLQNKIRPVAQGVERPVGFHSATGLKWCIFDKRYILSQYVQGESSPQRHGLTLILVAPLSTPFCMGRLKFARIDWAGRNHGRTSNSKSTQPNPTQASEEIPHPVFPRGCGIILKPKNYEGRIIIGANFLKWAQLNSNFEFSNFTKTSLFNRCFPKTDC